MALGRELIAKGLEAERFLRLEKRVILGNNASFTAAASVSVSRQDEKEIVEKPAS